MTGQAIADSLVEGKNAYNTGDYKKAAKLLKPLAEQGVADAQSTFGEMYLQGKGVLQDFKEAVKWVRLAAEQGNTIAQSQLGFMYMKGKGVLQNYVLAHMWTNIACTNEKSHAASTFNIEQRHSIATQMTTKQIAEAQELARKCTVQKFKGCE
jgi:TPR repeat protein